MEKYQEKDLKLRLCYWIKVKVLWLCPKIEGFLCDSACEGGVWYILTIFIKNNVIDWVLNQNKYKNQIMKEYWINKQILIKAMKVNRKYGFITNY